MDSENGWCLALLICFCRLGSFEEIAMINNARDLNDLKIPPANRLEKLKGKWEGQHSIR